MLTSLPKAPLYFGDSHVAVNVRTRDRLGVWKRVEAMEDMLRAYMLDIIVTGKII